jgi:hypothetical protein
MNGALTWHSEDVDVPCFFSVNEHFGSLSLISLNKTSRLACGSIWCCFLSELLIAAFEDCSRKTGIGFGMLATGPKAISLKGLELAFYDVRNSFKCHRLRRFQPPCDPPAANRLRAQAIQAESRPSGQHDGNPPRAGTCARNQRENCIRS